MKLNSTFALTLTLLAGMLITGIVTGAWGYTFGRKALKGVTQPAISPILGGAVSGDSSSRQGSGFLKETEILKNVQARINGPAKADSKKNDSQQKQQDKPKSKDKPFPISAQDQGVTLEVRAVKKASGVLSLEVAMKNDGPEPVQFLYTFLDITDDQGQPLTAITKGLPTRLAADGKFSKGSINIPIASLEKAKKLSLTLTDYPNQELQLKVPDIPVKNS